MTDRPSPSTVTDEGLVGRLLELVETRLCIVWYPQTNRDQFRELLKAELASGHTALLRENADLRAERDALLQRPIDLAKMDSIDDDASAKMVAYYWWQQAQEARAALSRPDDDKAS